MLIAFVAVLCSLLPLGGSDQVKKTPIPSAAAQAKAQALIEDELYRDELIKARKNSAEQKRLAGLFLQEAKDTPDDPAGRYVLYQMTVSMACRTGDAVTALQAIADLAEDYALASGDVFKMKVEALETSQASLSGPEGAQPMVESALALLDDALDADEFPAAHELLKIADAAAIKLKNVALVSSLRKRGKEVARLESDFSSWRPFAERLAKNPKDAEANLEMGKYQAFSKRNWERGLQLLAQGTGPLAEIAKRDLADPAGRAEQTRLAWDYFDQAEKLDGVMQTHVLLRSYRWYQQALADSALSAADRGKIEGRMEAIMKRVPADLRVGAIAVELKRCETNSGPLYCVAFAPDGRKALSGGADNSVRLWDVKTGKELKKLEGHTGRVWCVAFSPDGRRAASGGFDNTIRIWDISSGRELRHLSGHSDFVRSIVFSHDGHLLLSGGDDRVVRLWNADTGKEIRTFPGHDHFVWSVALSRDGKRALSASLDKTIRLWDVETGSLLNKLQGHLDTVLNVSFSPDGRRALSASTDKTLKLWDLVSATEMQTLTGHKGYVYSAAFSPDGLRALSTGQDQTLRLWDVHSGKELRTLQGHRDQVWCVTFSADGRLAASASQDQSVRIWGGK